MKKYLFIALWVAIAAYMVFALTFVSNKQENVLCTAINVKVSDTLENHIIDRNDVLQQLESDGQKILGQPIQNLNIAKIEKRLNDDPFIKHAEVYKEINGELTIEIEPRVPVIRIINASNQSYYIGQYGVLMPLSRKVQTRLIIANGFINYKPDFDTITNIYSNNFDQDDAIKVLRDIHTLVSFINQNVFWQSQTQEIYITEKKELEIIPLVGNQIILFGKIENYREKFRNLEAIYKKGFSAEGWNQFTEINLKYINQVICSKKE
ncbi:MAG: FtsQ-type POTRA domain-containing protein [Bacteroidales bacterium]|nr:FtsQ-type POTRA domain-containing protein [Bacteroidales bacterium]